MISDAQWQTKLESYSFAFNPDYYLSTMWEFERPGSVYSYVEEFMCISVEEKEALICLLLL